MPDPTICTCRHSADQHRATVLDLQGSTACHDCGCTAFVSSGPRRISGWARMLVQDAFDLSRKCVTCSCPAMHHGRTHEAPDCRGCGREPDAHRPGGVLVCRYDPGPPDGGCFMCNSKAEPAKCPGYIDPWALRPATPEPPREPAQEPAA